MDETVSNVPVSRLNRRGVDDKDDEQQFTAASASTDYRDAVVSEARGSDDQDVGNTYTVDEAIDHIGYGKFQNVLYVVCGIGFIADAAELMLLSFLLPAVQEAFDLKPWVASLLGSCIFIGMFGGASFWGWVSDRYGRRTAFMWSIMFTIVWGFASAFAPNIYALLILRTLTGFGVAGNHTVFSLFAEYVPAQGRGVHLSFVQIFWSLGAILEAALAWWLLPTKGWRWLLAVSALPLVFSALTFPWLPESPRYLVVHDRAQEADELLQTIARWNGATMPSGKLSKIVPKESTSFKAIFHPIIRKSTFILWYVWWSCTFCYYGIVLLTPLITNNRPSESGNEKVADIDYARVMLATLPELPGVFLAALLLAVADRIPSLGASFLFTGSFFLALLAYKMVSWGLTLVILSGARIATVSAFTIVYVYTLELYPTTIRSKGLGSCSSVARLAGMIAPFVSEVLWRWSWQATLVLCATVSTLAGGLTYLLTHETNNGSLPDELDHLTDPRSGGSDDNKPLLI